MLYVLFGLVFTWLNGKPCVGVQLLDDACRSGKSHAAGECRVDGCLKYHFVIHKLNVDG